MQWDIYNNIYMTTEQNKVFEEYFSKDSSYVKLADLIKNKSIDRQESYEFDEFIKYDTKSEITEEMKMIKQIKLNYDDVLQMQKLVIEGDICAIVDDKTLFINFGTMYIWQNGRILCACNLNILYYTKLIRITDKKIELDINDLPYFIQCADKSSFLLIEIMCDEYMKEFTTRIESNVFKLTTSDFAIIKSSEIIQIIFDLHGEHHKSNSSKLKINNYFNGMSNGFFIIGYIDDVIHIHIQLYDTYLNYSKQIIDSVCIKFCDTLLFVPFNSKSKHDELTYDSFKSGINFSKYDHCNSKIEITFDSYDNEIYILSNSLNFLKYENLNGSIMCYRIFSN